jgi:hypothetical protein
MAGRPHWRGWRSCTLLFLAVLAAGLLAAAVDAQVPPGKATQKGPHDDSVIIDWPDANVPSQSESTGGDKSTPTTPASFYQEEPCCYAGALRSGSNDCRG